jgi:hypothetical protein
VFDIQQGHNRLLLATKLKHQSGKTIPVPWRIWQISNRRPRLGSSNLPRVAGSQGIA